MKSLGQEWRDKAWKAYCADSYSNTIAKGKNACPGSRWGHDTWESMPQELRDEYACKVAEHKTVLSPEAFDKLRDQPAGDDAAVEARTGKYEGDCPMCGMPIGSNACPVCGIASSFMDEIADLRAKLDEANHWRTCYNEQAKKNEAELNVANEELSKVLARVAELERERDDLKDSVSALKCHMSNNGPRFFEDLRFEAAVEQAKESERAKDKALADLAAEQIAHVNTGARCAALGHTLDAMTERAEKAEESQRLTQQARDDDRGRLQQKCSDWGTYWRACDSHGVQLNIAQSTELLEDALGVEVKIDAARAEADACRAELATYKKDHP